MIELQDIHKSYMLGTIPMEVLRGVTLTVEQGELLAIVGASGCGKSTLMNILGFLDTPSSGRYLFEGRESSDFDDMVLSQIRNQRIGFCFQQFNLLPRLSALENVCLPLVYRGVDKPTRITRAKELLARVEMADRMDHRPSELSGSSSASPLLALWLAIRPYFWPTNPPGRLTPPPLMPSWHSSPNSTGNALSPPSSSPMTRTLPKDASGRST